MEVQLWQVLSYRFGFRVSRKSHLHEAHMLCLWKKKMLFCMRCPVSLKGVCSLKMLSSLSASSLGHQARVMWDRDVLAAPVEGQKAAKGERKPVEMKGEWERKSFQGKDVECHQSKRVGLRLFTSQSPLGNCFAFICIPLNFWRSFNWLIGSLTGSWLLFF